MIEAVSFHQIVARADHRVFTLAEARALFPLVRRLTQRSFEELEPVRRVLDTMIPANPRLREVEQGYETIVRRWVGKMERLGLVVKGLWLVDFDTGDGYLCWKFPELRIANYHGYREGYQCRRSIAEVVEEMDPDWARA